MAQQQPAQHQPARQPTAQQRTAQQPTSKPSASPIRGVTIPPGYRKWQSIAPAEEATPLDELCAVLGNPEAMAAIERVGCSKSGEGLALVGQLDQHGPMRETLRGSAPGLESDA